MAVALLVLMIVLLAALVDVAAALAVVVVQALQRRLRLALSCPCRLENSFCTNFRFFVFCSGSQRKFSPRFIFVLFCFIYLSLCEFLLRFDRLGWFMV